MRKSVTRLLTLKAIRKISRMLFLLPLFSVSAKNNLTIVPVDPLQNILPGIPFPAASGDTVRVARGENAVLQLVVSASGPVSGLTATVPKLNMKRGVSLPPPVIGWMGYVKSTHLYSPMAPDALQSPSGLYPDPILTDTSLNLEIQERAVLCLDIPIPEDATPGFYHGVVSVAGIQNGKRITGEQRFLIQVYPVTLPRQSLLVTNWYFPDKFPYMNNGGDVADDSPAYWECMKELVRMGSENGQNVWLLYETGKPMVSTDGKMRFDFTRMDKSIEFLLQNARVELIEANHLAKRSHNRWTDPFWAEVPVLGQDGKYVCQRLPYDDPRVEHYLTAYFDTLQQHLRSKILNDGSGRTWLDIYTQHVADEPLNENKESWEGLARFIKRAAPDIRIIEAYRSTSYDPALIDILVPQLDEFGWDSYRNVPDTHACWFYTCMYPRGNFANRYVTLPLVKTRLLHWINFKYRSPGYLHWGFNSWGANGDPYGDVSAPANDWPGGDSHIIYPGYRKVYPSARLWAMRDGIRDYELLKLVEARDQNQARRFADALVSDFDQYDTSVTHLRHIRHQMLEFLSANKLE